MITNDTWMQIRRLLPAASQSVLGGRPRVDDRACLNGVLYILQNRLGWGSSSKVVGYASGMTCWRRAKQWYQAGLWDSIRAIVVERHPEFAFLNWSRLSISTRNGQPRSVGGASQSRAHAG